MSEKFNLRRLMLACLAILSMALSSGHAAAAQLLVIKTADGQEVSLTREQLEAMPRTTFDTTTIWTEGAKNFSGVSLKAMLAQMGVTEGTLKAVAENEYSVDIPLADLDDHAPIVADLIDGQPFSRREKGPLWIVFPYDSDARYRTEENFARSIWQLVRIEVR